MFEFWKSFDICTPWLHVASLVFGSPLLFSCLCISSILIKGRPGRRRSRTPLRRRHEELAYRWSSTWSSTTNHTFQYQGCPPFTMHLTNHQCYSSSRFWIIQLHQLTAPTAHLPWIQTRIHNQKSLLKQPIASPDLQLFALKLHHHQVSQLQPKPAKFLARPDSFRASSAPAPKKRMSATQKSCLSPLSGNPAQGICTMQVMVRSPPFETWSEMGVQLSAKKTCSRLCLGTELTRLKNRLASIQCYLVVLLYPFRVKQC